MGQAKRRGTFKERCEGAQQRECDAYNERQRKWEARVAADKEKEKLRWDSLTPEEQEQETKRKRPRNESAIVGSGMASLVAMLAVAGMSDYQGKI